MNIVTEKKCSKCGIVKDICEFPAEKRNLDGFGGTCKLCEKERKRKTYLQNKEMYNAKSKEWRESHSDRVVEYRKEYRGLHGDVLRKENAEWKKNNSERVKESGAKYRKNNYEKIKAKFIKWMKNNIQEHVRRKKIWSENNQDKILEYSRNRRALVKNSNGKITSEEWRDLCSKYNNKCLCCGRSDIKLTLDHVIPLTLGGDNKIENAQPLCFSCNARKGARHIDYR